MHKRVLNFWFKESTPEQWFIKDPNFDEKIRNKFLKTFESAALGKLDDWSKEAHTCLALIIVLDQFPRNLFRNDNRSFKYDPKALKFCKYAIDNNYIETLINEERLFALLPLIHSENINDHIIANQVLDKYLSNLQSFERTKKSWNDHTAVIKLCLL